MKLDSIVFVKLWLLFERSEPERTLFIYPKVLCKNVLNGMKAKVPTTALAIISCSRHCGSEKGSLFPYSLGKCTSSTHLPRQPAKLQVFNLPSFSFLRRLLLLSPSRCHRLLASPSRSNSFISSRASTRSPSSRRLSSEKGRSPVVQYCPPT